MLSSIMKPFKNSCQKGFILVITLLVTAILVAVVSEFVYNVYISTARAANFTDSQRASLLAENGVELAQSAIVQMLSQNPFPTMDKDGMLFEKTDGDATVTIRLIDELSKVSTRIVYQDTGAKNDRIFDEYLRLLGVLGVADSYKLVDTLADWIDSDSEPRPYGAEGPDYYQRLAVPYLPANIYLRSPDEILMVKDYTPDVYYKIIPFTTVFNINGLVNINTSRKEVIMALSDDMTEEMANKVIEYRQEIPFKDKSDIMKVHGFEKAGFSLQDRITVQSHIFRVYSRAKVREAVRDVEAVIEVGRGVIYWREM